MTRTLARHAGAALTLVGGAVHLQQWWRVFRDLDIGPLFVANAVISIVVATLLLGRDDRQTPWAGIVLAVGSLIALLMSRNMGLFGFEATGLEAPEILAIVVEAGAAITLTIASLAGRVTSINAAPSPSP